MPEQKKNEMMDDDRYKSLFFDSSQENLLLKEEVQFLRKQLEYKSLGNFETMGNYERTND